MVHFDSIHQEGVSVPPPKKKKNGPCAYLQLDGLSGRGGFIPVMDEAITVKDTTCGRI